MKIFQRLLSLIVRFAIKLFQSLLSLIDLLQNNFVLLWKV